MAHKTSRRGDVGAGSRVGRPFAPGRRVPEGAGVLEMRQVRAEVHFTVNIDEEDGSYWAEVVEIPGCFLWGRSVEEIRAALPQAVECHLSLRDVNVIVHEGDGERRGPDAPLAGRGRATKDVRRAMLTAVGERPPAVVAPSVEAPLAELVSLADHRPVRD
jgi:predicted RNase H-like HicB family nuclease